MAGDERGREVLGEVLAREGGVKGWLGKGRERGLEKRKKK